MKQRTLVRIVTFLSAAALAALGWALTLTAQLRTAQRMLGYQYSHAFEEFVTAVDDMDAALQKSRYVTAPALQGQICSEIYGKALTAQMAMGVLPFATQELEQTAAFINRVGDYAASLSRAAAGGTAVSDEERALLGELAAASAQLADRLSLLQSGLAEGSVGMDSLDEAVEQAAPETLSGGMLDMEQSFPEVPSLVYDGPFSSHRERQEPLGTQGLEETDRETAMQAAAEFLGVSKSRVAWLGESGGTLPLWQYSVRLDEGEGYLAVTKAGARPYAYLAPTEDGTAALDTDDAEAVAEHYLARWGFSDMQRTYSLREGNQLTVSFAYRQGDVLCYSDLVKVTVSLADGSLRGFESEGYWNCHCERELPEHTQAPESPALCAGLTALSEQWALIPTPGGGELLCREYKCRTQDDTHCLIYLRADTGEQARILLLLEDENGTLAV